MKEFFSEFFLNDERVTNEIWENSTIVFDANVLLNLYEYSPETASEYISAMEMCKDRIKMPYWVVYEFLKNRTGIINDQIESYDKLILKLNDNLKCIKDEKKHPFVDSEKLKAFDRSTQSIIKELNRKKNEYRKNSSQNSDEKLDKLINIFSDKIGDSYNDEELDAIMKEGDLRMTAKIPPGYKDYKNKNKLKDSPNRLERCGLYGDYIIWKQILKIAEKNKTNILFVSNDSKEDWCDPANGQTKRELFKEFSELIEGKYFRVIQSIEFLEHINKQNLSQEDRKPKISKSSLDEVREREVRKATLHSLTEKNNHAIIDDKNRQLMYDQALEYGYKKENFNMNHYAYSFKDVDAFESKQKFLQNYIEQEQFIMSRKWALTADLSYLLAHEVLSEGESMKCVGWKREMEALDDELNIIRDMISRIVKDIDYDKRIGFENK